MTSLVEKMLFVKDMLYDRRSVSLRQILGSFLSMEKGNFTSLIDISMHRERKLYVFIDISVYREGKLYVWKAKNIAD